MNFQDKIAAIKEEIDSQNKKLALYKSVSKMFKDIEFPAGVNLYIHRYSYGDQTILIEFTPGWTDDSVKDLRPFVHRLTRHFRVNFKKSLNYDKQSLVYEAELEKFVTDASGEEVKTKYSFRVAGVVPATCKIVETETPLTEEEIEAARAKALADVQTVKINRQIVCD